MSTNSTQITQRIKKFVGKAASACRRCGNSAHWCNKLGGIVCLTCDPPRPCDLDATNSYIETCVDSSGEDQAECGQIDTGARIPLTLEISGLVWIGKSGFAEIGRNNIEKASKKDFSENAKTDKPENQIDTAIVRPVHSVNCPVSQSSESSDLSAEPHRQPLPGELKMAITRLAHELAKICIAAYSEEQAWHAFLPDEAEWGWVDAGELATSVRATNVWNSEAKRERAIL